MNCMAKKHPLQAFQDWITERGGIVEAARVISAYEESQGRKAISYQAIQQWLDQGRIPERRIPAISRATGIRVQVLWPELKAMA